VSNVVVRVARDCDVDSIHSIDHDYEHERYSYDIIKASIEDEKYYNLILSIDECDVGYLSAILVAGECELLKIVVKEKFRGNGYGKILMNALLAECVNRDTHKIFLEVRKDNTSAKALYEQCGFRKIHTRSGYYAGVDADVYWCEIDGKKY
jgi:ribosomal-protein-alanine N-acetyltransferase